MEPISVVITNKKGGVGKTMTTLLIASVLAEAGKSVRVIDLDRRQISSFSILANQAPGTVGARIIRDQEPGDEEIVIFDCPPSSDETPQQAVATAHLVLIPTTQEGLDVSVTLSFCSSLPPHLPDGTEVRVILTKWEKGRNDAKEILSEAENGFPYAVVTTPISKRSMTSGAMLSDDVWARVHPDTKAEAYQLVRELPLLKDFVT
jgi:chromosome partitioning protein